MKTNQFISKTIGAAMIAAAMIFGTSSAFAQVKIGTNPTVKGASNNLEVEASTTGRKTSVDKITGKVTITDGSEGADKVLTSDASGVSTWQKVGTQNVTQFPKAKLQGGTTSNFVSSVLQTVAFSTTVFTEGGAVKSGNGIQVPQSGYYQVSSRLTASNSAGCDNTALSSTAAVIFVNGVQTTAIADDKQMLRVPDNFTLNISTLLYLNANDVVSVQSYSNFVAQATGTCTTSIGGGDLSLSYQP